MIHKGPFCTAFAVRVHLHDVLTPGFVFVEGAQKKQYLTFEEVVPVSPHRVWPQRGWGVNV